MNVTKIKMLIIITIFFNMVYITWRIFFTIPQREGYISLFFALGLLFAEIMGVFELFVHIYGKSRQCVPKLPEVDHAIFPEVDVFIATYNEPVDLVRKTVNGCTHMKYPDKNKVNIVLCDDGNRLEMKKMAEELGVQYLGRNDNKGAKAGNLNNALKHTTSPLIVTFDADMIPLDSFLMETIPYFLEKKLGNIGFIQTPQSFYNTDLFQFNLYSEHRIPNEQDYFYRDIQASKNATNSVIYGGSNTVIAREALEAIGGFYEKSITEDFATGILIQSKGYRCYATQKVLASGLSPSDLKSLIKQRERWARGCIQTIRKVNILCLKGLTIGQKISYIAAISYWYASWKRFFYIMAPIVFTVAGIKVVKSEFIEVLIFFVPMYFFTSLTLKATSNYIRNTRWTNIYETIVFQSLMGAVILETFGISQKKFSVTNKNKVVTEDRIYQIKMMIPFTIYIILSLVGIGNVIRYIPTYENAAFVAVLFWLCSNLVHLLMAFFFVLGRKQEQEVIYHNTQIDYVMRKDNKIVRGKTSALMEQGFQFSFKGEWGEEFGESVICEIFEKRANHLGENKDKITCKVYGKIVCRNENGNNIYGFLMEDMDLETQDSWHRILHNRVPTMPQTIIDSKHIFHDLWVNLTARMNNIKIGAIIKVSQMPIS